MWGCPNWFVDVQSNPSPEVLFRVCLSICPRGREDQLLGDLITAMPVCLQCVGQCKCEHLGGSDGVSKLQNSLGVDALRPWILSLRVLTECNR